jgi:hypothetical protein
VRVGLLPADPFDGASDSDRSLFDRPSFNRATSELTVSMARRPEVLGQPVFLYLLIQRTFRYPKLCSYVGKVALVSLDGQTDRLRFRHFQPRDLGSGSE